MDLDQLEGIIKILKENDVTEFELSSEGAHIKLKRGSGGEFKVFDSAANMPLRATTQPSTPLRENKEDSRVEEDVADEAEIPEHFVKVTAPMVGTFYRRPSPDADPFVKEGDIVRKGQTVCIIEAMKLMNEIEAPASGKIVKICLPDASVVEYGELLFIIDPSE